MTFPRLGKRLGAVDDPRTLRLSAVLDAAATSPPARHVVAVNTTFDLYANDRVGDCTCAAMGHRITAQERSSGQSRAVPVTTGDVIAAYSAVTGYDPARPGSDTGAYMLDVLRFMRATGMGREADGTTHTIYAYARLDDPTDHDLVRRALWMFGGLYVGAGLPVATFEQYQAGETWHPTGDPERDRWGSWGGHAMYCRGYTPDALRLVSWGADRFASWDWWDAYVDEVWAVISEDFLRTNVQRTPQGFDRAALNSYLGQL